MLVCRWLGTHFHFKELQKDSPLALVPILQWISDRILPALLWQFRVILNLSQAQRCHAELPINSNLNICWWIHLRAVIYVKLISKDEVNNFLSEQEIWKYRSYIWGRLSNIPKLKVLPGLSRKSRTWHFCLMTALATVDTHAQWHELFVFFLNNVQLHCSSWRHVWIGILKLH